MSIILGNLRFYPCNDDTVVAGLQKFTLCVKLGYFGKFGWLTKSSILRTAGLTHSPHHHACTFT